MDLSVPTCENWTVDDVVFHVGGVYSHKLATLRLGRRPGKGDWIVPSEDASASDDLAWCHFMLHALSAELARRPAEQGSWTWWEPEQTVGFWQRRMAHETAVHRVDVESAVGPITAVDADLALDGIDELATVFLPASGASIPCVEVDRGMVTVLFDDVEAAGGASDVLLWLWGRLPDEVVALSGPQARLTEVRAALRAATQ